MAKKTEMWQGDGWIIESEDGTIVTQDSPRDIREGQLAFLPEIGRTMIQKITYVKGWFGWVCFNNCDCSPMHYGETQRELSQELDDLYGDAYDDGYTDDGGGSVYALT